MRASSASSAFSFISSNSTTSAPAPKNESTDDTKTSFSDVLHQQGGDDSGKSANSSTSNADKTSDVAVKAATPSPQPSHDAKSADKTSDIAPVARTIEPGSAQVSTPTTNANGKAKTPLPPGSDLASLIVQANVLASNAAKAAPTVTPATPATTPTSDTGKAPAKDAGKTAAGLDLTTLIAQAALATSKATAPATPNDPAATTTATAATAPATNLAQIAKVAAQVGTETPLATSTKGATPAPAKEKKSTSSSDEGSFLQSGTSASEGISNPLTVLTASLNATTDANAKQQVTPEADSKKSLADSLTAAPSSTAGTANVEKDAAMNATLNMTGMVAGNGATTLQHGDADVHIQLSSNNDFNDALKQVMHVASLSEASSSRTPLRVAMELQTPPGAIVNVYVSKQADGYRAQLSTNDPAALNWVQNKLSDLRNTNDLGVEVKWLPAQMEGTSTTVSSSSNSSNDGLAWDRGGQNQQGQQQDERQQQQRQQKGDLFPGMPSLANNPFMTTLNAVGRAA